MTDPLEQLLRAGTSAGPADDEALRLFAQVRATPDEGRVVHRLLVREAISPLPEPLLVAVASALVDRGELEAAAQALVRARSAPALMLRADLLEGAGEVSAALALVEQVLARDLDWPGARERHARWRGALGLAPSGHAPPAAAAPLPAVAPDLPYKLLREAGRGGSATVYEAEDLELLRRVAVKVYHRPERDRAKLLHEVRVAVAVAGEGVVPVFDADPHGGWIAMQWAALGALGSRRAVGPAAWAAALARALARVHAAGWVHHDVKPANVLLRAAGAPMLGDFGTARRRGEPSPPGSLGYVSPERLAGRASDPRDDVYGFGRVLAEALETGGPGASSKKPGSGWSALASACTGQDSARPADGGELVAAVERLSD